MLADCIVHVHTVYEAKTIATTLFTSDTLTPCLFYV